MTEFKFNNTLTERDMDFLFAEAIAADEGFANLFAGKCGINGQEYCIKTVEISKSDENGESDIVVVMSIDGERHLFLIEDKINAIAMPDQHGRYIKRAEKLVNEFACIDYNVFLYAPQKYRDNNKEAAKYENYISYEECKAYFDSKDDVASSLRSQQFDQAINKNKNGSNWTIEERANAFFRKYSEYVRVNYPKLDLRTKETSNGYWAEYKSKFGRVWITHKMADGHVDMKLSKDLGHMSNAENVAEWLNEHGVKNIRAAKTGNSVSIRINVPKLFYRTGFDNISEQDLIACLDAVQTLHKFAEMLEQIRIMTVPKSELEDKHDPNPNHRNRRSRSNRGAGD